MDEHTLPPKLLGDNGGPQMGPDMTPSELSLTQDNRLLSTRLRLAHGFQAMVLHAYDALLHHGVNYRDLPQHKDTALLDKGLNHGNLHEGEVHVMEWLKRMTSSITAAVRRKGIHKV